MLIWQYSAKKIVVDGGITGLVLERGEDGGIFFFSGEDGFEINPDDVSYVAFVEPKLFSKGVISFYGYDDEILTYIVDGREIACSMMLDRKQKDPFYMVFDVLQKKWL